MWFAGFESASDFLETIEPSDRGYLSEKIFLTLRQATIEHIVPLKAGGGYEGCNLEVLCALCNSRNDGTTPFGVTSWQAHE